MHVTKEFTRNVPNAKDNLSHSMNHVVDMCIVGPHMDHIQLGEKTCERSQLYFFKLKLLDPLPWDSSTVGCVQQNKPHGTKNLHFHDLPVALTSCQIQF